MRILFTSVGRRVELMRAFHEAARRLGLTCGIFATDIDPLAPAVQTVENFFSVPRHTHPEYIPRLLEICREEHIDAIVPLIDPDIPLLALARQDFYGVGTQVVAVEPSAAQISGDKWQTACLFQRLGLPAPKSWLPGDLHPEQHEYPLFIKPRHGSAASDTFKVNDGDELRFFQKYVRDPIIQEYLPDAEITSDILCNFEGTVLAVVSRQRIAVRGGEVIKGFTMYDSDIVKACHAIAQGLPARGPITAQCIMKNDVPHFIEINARLGGGIPLAIAAGVNVPEMLLKLLAGQAVEPIHGCGYELGLHMTRFDDSFFISSEKAVAHSSCDF